MAGINRTTGKATDLIAFSRASGGTALRKISYGPELVTNGTFDSDSGWSKGAGTVISDGVATSTSVPTGFTTVLQSIVGFSVGSVYKISVDVISITGVLRLIALGNVLTSQTISSAGTYTFTVTASASQTYLQSYGATTTCVVDNISVKEVLFDQPAGTLTLFNHPTNIPRIEYAADGTVKGLLIEEARTNLLTYSEDFTNASWVKGSGTGTLAVDATGPDGQTSAVTLVDSGAGGAGNVAVNKSVSVNTATNYTFSAFLKADGLSWAYLFCPLFTTPANGGAYFNLATGEIGTVDAGFTANIQDFGGGWYRCSVTFTTDAIDTSGRVDVWAADADGDFTVDLDGTSSILIYGAQFEAGSFPTSYIPTSGATATRAADIASISVDSFGYRQDAGTVVVEAGLSNLGNSGSGSEGIASFVANAAVENIGLYKRGGLTASQVRYEVRSSSITQATIDLVASDSNVKVSYSFAKDKFNLALDGSLGTEDTSGSVPVGVTDLALGNIYSVSGSFVLNGHIKSIQYYPRRLSNAQLQELTA